MRSSVAVVTVIIVSSLIGSVLPLDTTIATDGGSVADFFNPKLILPAPQPTDSDSSHALALVGHESSSTGEAPFEYPTFCTYTETYCKNGGYINTTNGDCDAWVLCPLDDPYYPMWYDTHPCVCPPHFAGVDCAIVLPSIDLFNTTGNDSCSLIAPETVWDGTFLNLNSSNKNMECFLDNTALQRIYSLRQHRVNITVDAVNGTIVFDVTSRHRNDSNVPPSPLYQLCGPVVHDIHCALWECTNTFIAGVVTYTCTALSCHGCPPSQDCSAFLNFVINALTPPISLTFHDIDSVHGVANLHFTTPTIVLDLGCQTGMCVKDLSATDSAGANYEDMIIAMAAAGVVFASLVGLCAYRANRKQMVSPAVSAAIAAAAAWRAGKSETTISAAATAAAYGSVLPNIEPHAAGVVGGGANGTATAAAGAAASAAPASGSSLEQKAAASGAEATPLGALIASPKEGDSAFGSIVSAGALPVSTAVVAPRFSLVFDAVTCEIQTKHTTAAAPGSGSVVRVGPGGPRMVLKGISGIVRPGEMVAIIGPSGAGKSTLLDILADRRSQGVRGFVGLHNDSYRAQRRKDVIHYVVQEDKLMPTQTVREALTFSATLRLPRGTPELTIAIAVQRVMDDLALSHIADSAIGSSDAGGISGGERKRVAIGMELVTEPGMILLDEPTTGLDSANAELVVKLMRETAARSCACVMTIHQPPARVFAMFDKVLLLSRRGELVYFGPTLLALQHFTQTLHIPPPDKFVNLCEWLVDVMACASAEQLTAMAAQYRHTEACAAMQTDVQNLKRQIEEQSGSVAGSGVHLLPVYARVVPGIGTRFVTLCGRTFRNISRDPSLMLSQTLVTVVMAVALGGVFWQLDSAIDGTQNRLGVLFFACIFFCLMSMSSLGILVNERALYLRERDAGYYTPLPYLWSQVVCDLIPMRMLPPLLFGAIFYFMIGLNPDIYRFLFCLYTLVLTNLAATTSCFLISAAVATNAQANLVASLWFIFCFLFGGLFYNSETTNSHATGLTYVSFVHYAFEALCTNEFMGLTLLFNPIGYDSVLIPGATILSNYAMNPNNKVLDVQVLILWCFGNLFITYWLLVFVSSPASGAALPKGKKGLLAGIVRSRRSSSAAAREGGGAGILAPVPTRAGGADGNGHLNGPTQHIVHVETKDEYDAGARVVIPTPNQTRYNSNSVHPHGSGSKHVVFVDAAPSLFKPSPAPSPSPPPIADQQQQSQPQQSNGPAPPTATGPAAAVSQPVSIPVPFGSPPPQANAPLNPLLTLTTPTTTSFVPISSAPELPSIRRVSPAPESRAPILISPAGGSGAGLNSAAADNLDHPFLGADDRTPRGGPAPAFSLVYDNVTCELQTRTTESGPVGSARMVLSGISGVIRPGEMVAILGPSGAGKSTLLDILADRRREGVKGFVGLDNDAHRCQRRKDVIHYVLQDDKLMPTQTVREALTFSATLRMPFSTSRATINHKVNRVMEQLSLTHIANSMIGNSDRGGISGGERKRVAIGMELVTEPGMILLDEPTSGLDSSNAELVVSVLKSEVTGSRSCACMMTIHQPPAAVFALFDQIVLLNRRGQLVFVGPIAAAMTHFTQTVGLTEPNKFVNLAEWLVDIMATATDDELTQMQTKYVESESYRKLSAEVADTKRRIETARAAAIAAAAAASGLPASISAAVSDLSPMGSSSTAGEYRRDVPGFGEQFKQLSIRTLRNIARNPSLLLTQSIVTILVALSLGGVFWHVNNLIDGTQNRLGMLFFSCIFFSLMSMSSLSLLVEGRLLYLRECDAGYYTPLPYFLSQLCCDLVPMRVLPPLAFGGITYYMMGLNDAPGRFGFCLAALVLVNLVATTSCFAISAAVNTNAQANLAASLYFVFALLFGGLFFNAQTTNSNATYLTYVSFVHFAWEALCANEFVGLNLVFNPKGYDITYITGDTILTNYALDKSMQFWDILILCGWVVFSLVVTYLLLRFRRGVYRK